MLRDYAIRGFITSNASAKQCSFCGRRSRRRNIAAPGDAVLEFILHGINSEYGDADEHAIPYDSEEGEYIFPVYDIYDLVHEEHTGISSDRDVLDWIVNSVSDGRMWCEKEPGILSPEEGLVAGWEDFCEAVKHKSRYLFFEPPRRRAPHELLEPGAEPHYVHPAGLLEEIAELVKAAGLIRELPAGTPIFRVRPHEQGVQFTTPAELGPPPEDSAKAGRMSAAGIVVFYGALEESTAVAETARGNPAVSIGLFVLVRAARVLDLTNLPPIPSIFDDGKRGLRVRLRFLYRFRRDISEPIEPDDRIHVEYTPTQVVSEFIKLRFRDQKGNRVDGVLYPSSRRESGCNPVLFANRDNIEGIPTDSYRKPSKLLRLSSSKTIKMESDPDSSETIQKQFRARAYELYEQRGMIDGYALDDWFQAEAEVLGAQKHGSKSKQIQRRGKS